MDQIEHPPAGGTEDGGRPSAPETAICPFCRSGLPEGASKCAACGSNVGEIKICTQCQEPVRLVANVCPFCAADLRPPEPEQPPLLGDPWVIEASPIGAFFVDRSLTALIFPPTITISETEISMHRRMLLGLRKYDQKLAVSRIASVRAATGPIWGSVIVETYGGASGDLVINGLDKEDAAATAQLVERLAHPDGQVDSAPGFP